MILSGVSHLLLFCDPPAVARLVVPVVVDPVDFQPTWSATHIKQEGFEASPSVANRNPAPAVIMIIARGWYGATTKHLVPRVACSLDLSGCWGRMNRSHGLSLLRRFGFDENRVRG